MRPPSRTRRCRATRPRAALVVLAAAIMLALASAAFLAHARAGAADLGRTVQRGFMLTGISPNFAATGEGVHATISGSGLDRTGRYDVNLVMGATTIRGGTPRVSPGGDSMISTISLASAPVGVYDVQVTDQKSAETHTLTGAFTVTASSSPGPDPTAAAPVISSISPTKGLRGSKVTIKGSNFGKPRGTGYVKFGAKQCTKYVSWSATKIVCKVPARARQAKVKVCVYTAAGASNTKNYTVKKN
jgi:hypothetical protein